MKPAIVAPTQKENYCALATPVFAQSVFAPKVSQDWIFPL